MNTGSQRPAHDHPIFLWTRWESGAAAGVFEWFQYSTDCKKMGKQALVLWDAFTYSSSFVVSGEFHRQHFASACELQPPLGTHGSAPLVAEVCKGTQANRLFFFFYLLGRSFPCCKHWEPLSSWPQRKERGKSESQGSKEEEGHLGNGQYWYLFAELPDRWFLGTNKSGLLNHTRFELKSYHFYLPIMGYRKAYETSLFHFLIDKMWVIFVA